MAIYKKDGVDGVNSFPRKLVGLKISIADGSSVTVGDWMAIDTSFTTEGVGAGCKVTTASDETVFGVSTQTISNSTGATKTYDIVVQTAGRFVDANINSSAVAPGNGLDGHDGATNGRAGLHAETDAAGACGIVLTDGGSNLGTVMIIDKGYY